MVRAFFALVVLTLLLGACTQRMICPAYQSAFIYDQDELRKRFSYFEDDSTPKILTASKNKYLIAETPSYKKKIRMMQTVPMKPVNVNLPDSLKEGIEGEDGVIPGAELDLAARSVIDSIYIEDVEQDTLAADEDSVYMISKDKELRLLKYNFPDSLVYDPATGKYVRETPKYVVTEVRFNVEQDNYMWYLRDYLVLPDVRLAKMGGGGEKSGDGKVSGKKEKKGFFGFFKNLFKKKDKEAAADSTAAPVQAQPDEEEFDYVDEDEQLKAQQPQQQQEPEKKGGLFKKKKDKSADDAAPSEEKPAKKKKEKKVKKVKTKPEDEPATEEEQPAEEEDDDGF
ncbi:MAG TPA: hypothetical protein VGK59_17845 [Ohtaekwangia sp.]